MLALPARSLAVTVMGRGVGWYSTALAVSLLLAPFLAVTATLMGRLSLSLSSCRSVPRRTSSCGKVPSLLRLATVLMTAFRRGGASVPATLSFLFSCALMARTWRLLAPFGFNFIAAIFRLITCVFSNMQIHDCIYVYLHTTKLWAERQCNEYPHYEGCVGCVPFPTLNKCLIQ